MDALSPPEPSWRPVRYPTAAFHTTQNSPRRPGRKMAGCARPHESTPIQPLSGDIVALPKVRKHLKFLTEPDIVGVSQAPRATVGQNALSQVDIFRKTVGVTGLALTKLEGTARGGILVAIAAKFPVPVFHRRRRERRAPFSARDLPVRREIQFEHPTQRTLERNRFKLNCFSPAGASICAVKGSHVAPLVPKGFFEQCQNRRHE